MQQSWKPLVTHLDPIDIIRNYDEAIIDFLSVQIDIGKDVRWSRNDLNALPVASLHEICDRRGLIYADKDGIYFPREVLTEIILNYQRIPIVFGAPSPQFGVQPWLLTGRPEAYATKRIPYPLMVVTRLTSEQDDERFQGAVRRKIAWSNRGQEVAQSNQPLPINFTYQLDVLGTKLTQMNQVDLAMMRLFQALPLNIITVEHGSPWGKLPVYIDSSKGYANDSQLEAPSDTENAEKLLRHIWTLTVMGWIPQTVSMVKTVRKLRVSIGEMLRREIILEEFNKTPTLPPPEPQFETTFVEEGFVEDDVVE